MSNWNFCWDPKSILRPLPERCARQFKVENVGIDCKKVLSVMCICSMGQYAQKSRPVVPKVSDSPRHAKVSFERVVMCTRLTLASLRNMSAQILPSAGHFRGRRAGREIPDLKTSLEELF